jgi:hypothetical protein
MKFVALITVAAGIATGAAAQTAPAKTGNSTAAGAAAPAAQPAPAGKSAVVPATGNTTATKAGQAAKTVPPATSAAKAPAKKAEAPPKIEGMEIARGAKGFLGLQLVGGTFKLSFYDMKKKPVAPDVARAMLRWDPKGKVGQERLVLNRDGMALSSPRPVKPPYVFKLFITLLPEGAAGDGADAAPAGETIVVDFKG